MDRKIITSENQQTLRSWDISSNFKSIERELEESGNAKFHQPVAQGKQGNCRTAVLVKRYLKHFL